MAEFTELFVKLGDAAQDVDRERRRLETARKNLQTAVDTLTALPGQFAGLASDIDTGAAANPTNQEWQRLKDRKDLVAADFVALRTLAELLLAAYDGV